MPDSIGVAYQEGGSLSRVPPAWKQGWPQFTHITVLSAGPSPHFVIPEGGDSSPRSSLADLRRPRPISPPSTRSPRDSPWRPPRPISPPKRRLSRTRNAPAHSSALHPPPANTARSLAVQSLGANVSLLHRVLPPPRRHQMTLVCARYRDRGITPHGQDQDGTTLWKSPRVFPP